VERLRPSIGREQPWQRRLSSVPCVTNSLADRLRSFSLRGNPLRLREQPLAELQTVASELNKMTQRREQFEKLNVDRLVYEIGATLTCSHKVHTAKSAAEAWPCSQTKAALTRCGATIGWRKLTGWRCCNASNATIRQCRSFR
jgi:hypothetical protein